MQDVDVKTAAKLVMALASLKEAWSFSDNGIAGDYIIMAVDNVRAAIKASLGDE